MTSGCRIAQHTIGFYSKLKFSSCSGASSNSSPRRRRRLLRGNSLGIVAERGKGSAMASFPPPLFISCLQCGSPGESPVLPDSLSQKEEEDKFSSEGLSSVAGGIVALGKFDALHIGHRELAVQASKVGTPYLLSFVGMAQVLGWEPRAPIVATCDRKRVLSSWARYCCDVVPEEILMEFSTVRHLTPRQFVEKLAKEIGVGGIVAGENYRFGYRASGDTSDLLRLCDEFGIRVYTINSVMDKNQKQDNSLPKGTKERGQVSSTRVRYALSKGDVNYVSELLGRRHRVILSFENKEMIVRTEHGFSAPKTCLLNLPPKDGYYDACSLVIGNENSLPCKVTFDSQNIHLDLDLDQDQTDYILHLTQSIQLVGIEFESSDF